MIRGPSLSLTVFHEIRASHSLAGFETPHFHVWKFAVRFSAGSGEEALKDGRLIDLIELQEKLEMTLSAFEGRYLNALAKELNGLPTTENFALWLWAVLEKGPYAALLRSVSVTLCDLEGRATGTAEVTTKETGAR